MADQPGILQPVSPPPASPAPAAAAPPPSPAPQPAATPQVPPPGEPALSPDQVIEIADPRGGTHYAKLGELVNAYQSRPDIGGDELAELRTVRDALKGDPVAVNRLMQSFQGGQPGPGQPPAHAVPGQAGQAPVGSPAYEAELAAVRQQVADMQEVLMQARGVTEPIMAIQERNFLQAKITEHANYVPAIARTGEQGAALVQGEFRRQMNMAREGQHPDFPGQRLTPQNMLTQHKERILGRAMLAVEGQVRSLFSAAGVQLQAQPAPAAPAAGGPAGAPAPGGLIDDQAGKPQSRPAQIRLVNGQLTRADTGVPLDQNRMGGMIPADMVDPSGRGGTPLPVGAPPANRQPYDQNGLMARMQQRIQQWNANRQ